MWPCLLFNSNANVTLKWGQTSKPQHEQVKFKGGYDCLLFQRFHSQRKQLNTGSLTLWTLLRAYWGQTHRTWHEKRIHMEGLHKKEPNITKLMNKYDHHHGIKKCPNFSYNKTKTFKACLKHSNYILMKKHSQGQYLKLCYEHHSMSSGIHKFERCYFQTKFHFQNT